MPAFTIGRLIALIVLVLAIIAFFVPALSAATLVLIAALALAFLLG